MKNNLRRAALISWRTTLGGLLAGIGIVLLGIAILPDWGWSHPGWVKQCGMYGLFFDSVGIVVMGIHSRDHGVSSEQARGEL